MKKAPMQRPVHQADLMRPSLIVRPLLQARWALLPVALLPLAAIGNPTGGSVVAGQASINGGSGLTTIQQQSASAVINWQQFGIGNGETVNFVQPSASAAILNRVIGGDASAIFGNLTSNGRVFLINPQGVMFGAGARVDVGSLVASTLDIRNEDFMAGRYVLAGDANPAAVSNDGVITARDGGFVVLASGDVRNGGLIQTRLGDVVLASGAGLTLDMNDTGLISYRIDAAALSDVAGVTNTGSLMADGGRVFMAAKVARELAATAVNNSGTVRAASIGEQDGVIVLEALGGNTENSGTLTATSETGSGGSIQVIGDQDVLVNGGTLNASGATGGGVIRIGGGWQGGEGLTTAARTYLAPTAIVRADALDEGNGGNIVLWSDHNTVVAGLVSAVGAGSGNGGNVETSSHGGLAIDNAPRISGGAQGSGGSWLIDPYNLTIVSGGSTVGVEQTASTFTSTGDDATIEVGVITDALAGGGNVTVQTANGGGTQAGDLVLNADVNLDFSNTGNSTLSLVAFNDIQLNGNIFGSGSSGNPSSLTLNLNAGAAINFNGPTLSTNGGAIAATANGNVSINSNINTGGGVASFSGASETSNIAITGSVFTAGGDLTLSSGSAAGIGFGFFPTSTLNAGATGTLRLTAGTDGISYSSSSPTLNGYDVVLDSVGSIALSGASITALNQAAFSATTGSINLGQLTAGAGLTLSAMNGGIDTGDVSIGNDDFAGDLTGTASGDLSLGTVRQNASESGKPFGHLSLSAGGNLSATFEVEYLSGGMTASSIYLSEGNGYGGDINFQDSDGGDFTFLTATSGGITLRSQYSLSAYENLDLAASGSIELFTDGDVDVGNLTAGGPVDIGGFTRNTNSSDAPRSASVTTGSISTTSSDALGNDGNANADVRIAARNGINIFGDVTASAISTQSSAVNGQASAIFDASTLDGAITVDGNISTRAYVGYNTDGNPTGNLYSGNVTAAAGITLSAGGDAGDSLTTRSLSSDARAINASTDGLALVNADIQLSNAGGSIGVTRAVDQDDSTIISAVGIATNQTGTARADANVTVTASSGGDISLSHDVSDAPVGDDLFALGLATASGASTYSSNVVLGADGDIVAGNLVASGSTLNLTSNLSSIDIVSLSGGITNPLDANTPLLNDLTLAAYGGYLAVRMLDDALASNTPVLWSVAGNTAITTRSAFDYRNLDLSAVGRIAVSSQGTLGLGKLTSQQSGITLQANASLDSARPGLLATDCEVDCGGNTALFPSIGSPVDLTTGDLVASNGDLIISNTSGGNIAVGSIGGDNLGLVDIQGFGLLRINEGIATTVTAQRINLLAGADDPNAQMLAIDAGLLNLVTTGGSVTVNAGLTEQSLDENDNPVTVTTPGSIVLGSITTNINGAADTGEAFVFVNSAGGDVALGAVSTASLSTSLGTLYQDSSGNYHLIGGGDVYIGAGGSLVTGAISTSASGAGSGRASVSLDAGGDITAMGAITTSATATEGPVQGETDAANASVYVFSDTGNISVSGDIATTATVGQQDAAIANPATADARVLIYNGDTANRPITIQTAGIITRATAYGTPTMEVVEGGPPPAANAYGNIEIRTDYLEFETPGSYGGSIIAGGTSGLITNVALTPGGFSDANITAFVMGGGITLSGPVQTSASGYVDLLTRAADVRSAGDITLNGAIGNAALAPISIRIDSGAALHFSDLYGGTVSLSSGGDITSTAADGHLSVTSLTVNPPPQPDSSNTGTITIQANNGDAVIRGNSITIDAARSLITSGLFDTTLLDANGTPTGGLGSLTVRAGDGTASLNLASLSEGTVQFRDDVDNYIGGVSFNTGNLTVQAQNFAITSDVNLGGSLSLTSTVGSINALALNAGADLALNSAQGITASSLIAGGALTASANNGALRLDSATAGSLSLTAGSVISQAADGPISLITQSGILSVDAASLTANGLTLRSASNLNLNNTALDAGAALATLQAGAGTVFLNTTVTAGSLTVTGLSISGNSSITVPGALSLTATEGDVTLVSGSGGTVTVSASGNVQSIGSGLSLTSTGGDLSVTATSLTSTGSLNLTTTGGNIALGSTAIVAGITAALDSAGSITADDITAVSGITAHSSGGSTILLGDLQTTGQTGSILVGERSLLDGATDAGTISVGLLTTAGNAQIASQGGNVTVQGFGATPLAAQADLIASTGTLTLGNATNAPGILNLTGNNGIFFTNPLLANTFDNTALGLTVGGSTALTLGDLNTRSFSLTTGNGSVTLGNIAATQTLGVTGSGNITATSLAGSSGVTLQAGSLDAGSVSSSAGSINGTIAGATTFNTLAAATGINVGSATGALKVNTLARTTSGDLALSGATLEAATVEAVNGNTTLTGSTIQVDSASGTGVTINASTLLTTRGTGVLTIAATGTPSITLNTPSIQAADVVLGSTAGGIQLGAANLVSTGDARLTSLGAITGTGAITAADLLNISSINGSINIGTLSGETVQVDAASGNVTVAGLASPIGSTLAELHARTGTLSLGAINNAPGTLILEGNTGIVLGTPLSSTALTATDLSLIVGSNAGLSTGNLDTRNFTLAAGTGAVTLGNVTALQMLSLDADGSVTASSLSGGSGVSLSAASLTVANATSSSAGNIVGNITGAASFNTLSAATGIDVASSSGLLTITSGATTTAGNVTLGGSTLDVGNLTASAGNITLNGSSATIGRLRGNGVILNTAAGLTGRSSTGINITALGTPGISGAASLISGNTVSLVSAGGIQLGNSAIRANSGTVVLDSSGAVMAGTVAGVGSVTVNTRNASSINLGTVTATGSAGNVLIGERSTGGNIDAGLITVGVITGAGQLTVASEGGNVTVGGIGGSPRATRADLSSSGTLTLGTLTNAPGTLNLTGLNGLVLGSALAGNLTATNLSLTTQSSSVLSLGSFSVGALNIQTGSGGASLGAVTSASTVTLGGSGAYTASGPLMAAGLITLGGSGFSGGTVTSTAGGITGSFSGLGSFGAVQAAQDVMLTSTANRLTFGSTVVSSGGDITLLAAQDISLLAGATANAGAITLTGTAGGVSTGGDLVAQDDLKISSTSGRINLPGQTRSTGGNVLVSTGSVNTGVVLDPQGTPLQVGLFINDGHAANLFQVTSGGNIAINTLEAGAVTVNTTGSLSSISAIDLGSTAGDLSVTASSIQAPTLTLDSAAALIRSAPINVAGLTTLVAGSGTLNLANITTNSLDATAQSLVSTGAIVLPGTLSLTATQGNIITGALTAASITESATTGIRNGALVASSGSVTATTGNALTTGRVSAVTGATLSTTGALTLNGPLTVSNGDALLTATGNVMLGGSGTASGAFTVTSGSDILGNSSAGLKLTAGTVSLDAEGNISSATAPLSLTSTVGTLTVAANSITGPSVSLDAETALIRSGLINTTGLANIAATVGTVSLDGITAGSLLARAPSLSASNAITLNGFIDLLASNGALMVADISAAGPITLVASAGNVTAGSITGSSASLISGAGKDVTITGLGNVTGLLSISSGRNIFAHDLSGGSLALNATGNLSDPGHVYLTATSLTGTVSGNIGNVNAPDVRLDVAGDVTLDVSGSVNTGAAGSIRITSVQDITDLDPLNTGTLTITAPSVNFTAGTVVASTLATITASNGGISLDGFTGGSLVANATNGNIEFNNASTSGALTARAVNGNIYGSYDGGSVTLDADNNIDANVTADGLASLTARTGFVGVDTVTAGSILLSAATDIEGSDTNSVVLRSTSGSIGIAAPVINAGLVDIGSAGAINLGSTNINAGTASGNVVLNAATGTVALNQITTRDLSATAQAISSAAAITLPGALNLTASAGNVTLSSASAGTVSITAAQQIRGSAAGPLTLVSNTGGLAVSAASITGSNVTLDAETTLTRSGTINTAGLASIAATAGSVSLDGITANSLTATAPRLVATGALALPGTLNLTATAGDVTLASASAGSVSVAASGNVQSTGTTMPLSLTSSSGDVVITAGGLNAASINLNAAGNLLTGSTRLNAGSSGSMTLAAGSGTVDFSRVTTRNLSVTAATINNTEALVIAGDLTLKTTAGDLTTGAVTAGGDLELLSSGDIDVGTLRGNNATVLSYGGTVRVASADLSGIGSLTALAGSVATDNFTAGAISISGSQLRNYTLSAGENGYGGDINLTSTVGGITVSAPVVSQGAVTLDSATGITVKGIEATRDVSLAAQQGGITATGSYRTLGNIQMLAQSGSITLDNSSIEGNLSYLSADTITASEAVSIDVAALSAAGRILDFSGANIVVGEGQAPRSSDFGLINALAQQGFILPSSLVPNASFDATEALTLASVGGTAHYIVLRAPVASLPNFGSISSTSGDLFLQYAPTDNAADFTFDLAQLSFANSAATFAFGSSDYMGAIFITDPSTGIVQTPDKALTADGNNTNYITLSSGNTFGAETLQSATTGQVLVLGPATPTTPPAPPPPAPPPPTPEPPIPTPPAPTPVPVPDPVAGLSDQNLVLLGDQLIPAEKKRLVTELSEAQLFLPDELLVTRDSVEQASQQCDAIQ